MANRSAPGALCGAEASRGSRKHVAVGDNQVHSGHTKENVMVEVEASSGETNLPVAQPQARPDFSGVQGFQVVGAEGHGAAQAPGDEAWRDALKLELEARAARLHQAVDTAIVLSNDGVIRWLGDPVARLSPGADVLNPSAVILADESLPVESRETIKTRIELWIGATTRRVLAPLFALEAIREGPEIVQNLAHDLARSFGILEREPIKAQINALAQNDRAELRKQGVRFGAYYLFVPALIKPAPRNLALQLWGLQAPGDANELLRTLGPVASSGRTSLPVDKTISKEGYRIAGYRPCGERIVRVDVVERLAGMIRAAIGGEALKHAPGGPNRQTAKGFVVSGEMTSLTGCSGEQFASILRSMGFRMVEMRRSEFFKSSSASGSPGQDGSAAPAEEEPPVAHDQTPSSAAPEQETPIDTPLASPPADSVPVDMAPSGVSADLSSGVDTGGESVASQTSGSSCESEKKDDMVVVWRPDRRSLSPHREREGRQSKGQLRGRLNPHSQSPDQAPKPLSEAAVAGLPTNLTNPNRSLRAKADEKRRQRTRDHAMPRPNPITAPQPTAKVDPNSPFAKLLELRPLLEEQANKRP
jgi:ATP-dependent RNA helicase SUPV3L1/SUV3